MTVISYRIDFVRNRRRSYSVSHDGRIVHRAASLLAAENWVTRGGADAYEQAFPSATIGVSDTPADAGVPGTACDGTGDSPTPKGPVTT